MNQILKHALQELEALSEEQQRNIAERLQDMIARARIDHHLSEAEARGGSTPSDRVFADLRRELIGSDAG